MVDGAADKYSAAGSAAGYLFQCRYALLAALRHAYASPGMSISIEKFDDVGFELDGTPLERIQTKHHLRRPGDLTDSSTDLWKTLRIWAEAVERDPSLPQRQRFALVTTATAAPGSAASFLRPAWSRSAARALQLLVAAAEASKNKANQPFYDAFLRLGQAARLALLDGIDVLDAAPDLVATEAELDAEIRRAVARDRVDALRERLEGWWWGRVCRALVAREDADAVVAVDDVEAKIDELREGFRRDALPVDMGAADLPEEMEATYEAFRFVRQLRLIGMAGRPLARAKLDFYRAFEQRSRWARERLLAPGELSEYERRLVEEWEPRYDGMCERLEGCDDEPRICGEGKGLFRWAEAELRLPLRSVVERFLSMGSLHILADDGEGQKVGWHRDFRIRLGGSRCGGNGDVR